MRRLPIVYANIVSTQYQNMAAPRICHIVKIMFLGYCLIQTIETTEFCMTETFTAKCPDNEVILMSNAMVGRMKIGRCITVNVGRLGCSTNVLDVMDRLCSGKKECSTHVSSDELTKTKPCGELMIALESSYTCIQVSNSEQTRCSHGQRLAVPNENSHMSSKVADSTGCGHLLSPWYLHANPGQTIHITVTLLYQTMDNGGSCKTVGYVFEEKLTINKTLCVTQKRNQNVYRTVGNEVGIFILPKQQRGDIEDFYITYKVYGCPDLNVPQNAIYSREGPKAEYGCKYSKKTWKLQCVNNNWVGVIGNCSETEYVAGNKDFENTHVATSIPDSVIIAIIIGAALLIASLIFVCALVCIWNKRNTNPKQPNYYNRQNIPTMPRCSNDQNQQYRTMGNKQYNGNSTLQHMPAGTIQYGNMPTGTSEYKKQPDSQDCDCYYPTSDASYEFSEGRKYHVLERQPPEHV